MNYDLMNQLETIIYGARDKCKHLTKDVKLIDSENAVVTDILYELRKLLLELNTVLIYEGTKSYNDELINHKAFKEKSLWNKDFEKMWGILHKSFNRYKRISKERINN